MRQSGLGDFLGVWRELTVLEVAVFKAYVGRESIFLKALLYFK